MIAEVQELPKVPQAPKGTVCGLQNCKTCKWWLVDDDERYARITQPEDIDTGVKMELPFEVRHCYSPRLLFYERPLESCGAAVVDGSMYQAALLTAEDYGCPLHEELS